MSQPLHVLQTLGLGLREGESGEGNSDAKLEAIWRDKADSVGTKMNELQISVHGDATAVGTCQCVKDQKNSINSIRISKYYYLWINKNYS